MGIIVKERATETITFYVKGADTVMSKMVKFNDWVSFFFELFFIYIFNNYYILYFVAWWRMVLYFEWFFFFKKKNKIDYCFLFSENMAREGLRTLVSNER